MLTALLTVALAMEPEQGVTAVHPGPYAMDVDPRGHLLVYDAHEQLLSTPEVLDLIHRPEDARRYRLSRGLRTAGAIGLWTAGGVVGVFSVLQGDSNGIAAAGVLEVGGVALVYAPQKNQLLYWVDEHTLYQALEAYGPRPAEDPASHPPLASSSHAWHLDEDGHLVTADDRLVSVPEIAQALGESQTEGAYHSWLREQQLTWGVLLTGGFGVTIGGLLVNTLAEAETTRRAGMATVPVGAAMGVGGAVGLGLVMRPGVVRRWFTPEQIQQAISEHNAMGLGLPPASTAPSWTVQPMVGPGYVGVQGTF